MRTLLLLLLAGCASGGLGDGDEVVDLPLGSFCLGEEATRTCLAPGAATAVVSSSDDNLHVRVQATFVIEYEDPTLGFVEEEATIELEAQVPAGARLPRAAERVHLTFPALGTCRSARPVSPFGGPCGRFDAPAICYASAYDDPALVGLELVALDDERVGGRFTSPGLPFTMPQGTCDNEASCVDVDEAEFTPAAPLPGEGLFHLPLAAGP